jgi:hypothetical protein
MQALHKGVTTTKEIHAMPNTWGEWGFIFTPNLENISQSPVNYSEY